jgi:hypothetical protein
MVMNSEAASTSSRSCSLIPEGIGCPFMIFELRELNNSLFKQTNLQNKFGSVGSSTPDGASTASGKRVAFHVRKTRPLGQKATRPCAIRKIEH